MPKNFEYLKIHCSTSFNYVISLRHLVVKERHQRLHKPSDTATKDHHSTPCAVLESFEQLLKISTDPVALCYDTVFNIGDYYLSILTFRHAFFIGNPIIPCGCMIHSKRYHSDHCEFLRATTSIVPALTSKQVNIIIDREFKLFDKFILPVGNQLYCWNHLENDLYWHLKKTSNCTAKQITYFTTNA